MQVSKMDDLLSLHNSKHQAEFLLKNELGLCPGLSEKEATVHWLLVCVRQKMENIVEWANEREMLAYFEELLNAIREPFSVTGLSQIPDLDRDIRAKKISLSARAIDPTPVLHSHEFTKIFWGTDGSTLLLDEYGQIDEVEFVALPGTVFSIEGILLDGENIIYRVSSKEYPHSSDVGYFIDARSMEAYWTPLSELSEREKILPSQQAVINNLRACLGLPYIWGGNIPQGISNLPEFYPPKWPVQESQLSNWSLRGVDCSWLLYAATHWYTPRNTSALIDYGEPLSIEWKWAEEISALIEPLDLILTRGHVLIALDQGEIIQSSIRYSNDQWTNGVKAFQAIEILQGLLSIYIPADSIDTSIPAWKKQFVVRRWHRS